MKKDNPIPDQLAIFADRLRQVCRGHRTACACDGPPGLGKTHTLKTITSEENKLLRLVSTTAGGLVQMLYRYKDIPVVAFDDFDKALRNEATANIVKQATAPEPVRRITHQTVTAINNAARNNPKDHIAPPVFSVRCGLVMLTNVDMTDPKTIDKAMREHVRALADRGLEFIHISRDPRHVIDYVADLAPTIFPDVDPAIRSEVAEFFVENGLKFETVSVPRIQSIMKDRLTMPVRWKQLQASTFVRDAPRVREPEARNHSENTEVGKSAIVPFRGMRREYSRRNESKAGDVVMTPLWFAKQIIDYFPLQGVVLDPCRGVSRAFYDQYPDHVQKDWCEILEDRNFFDWKVTVDWVIGNPPWSGHAFTAFMSHAMKVADNVVLLIPSAMGLTTKKRIRVTELHGHGLKEIVFYEWPVEWKQFAFSLTVHHWQRGWAGGVKVTNLMKANKMVA